MGANFFKLDGEPVKLDEASFSEMLEHAEIGNEDATTNIQNILYEPDTWPRKNNKIQNAIFKNCSFSKTLIYKTTFNNVQFEDCLFIGSEIKNCEFHDCSFVRCNTYKFTLNKTYISPAIFGGAVPAKKYTNVGVDLYQMLLDNARNSAQPEHYAYAMFMFKRWKRWQSNYEYVKYRKTNPTRARKAKLEAFGRLWYELLLGSGVRVSHFLLTVLIGLFFITTINWCFRHSLGLELSNFIDAIYYTVISLTTVGYGDITPSSMIGKIWASIQGVVGLVGFALLAALGFRKISPL